MLPRAPRQAKPVKQDAESLLVQEKLEQFGRRWEVQSCAAGSSDKGCLLQAAKSLTALVAALEQHKVAAHKPQTRHAASRGVPWGPLLRALLHPAGPQPALSLTLPALASLTAFMPEVVPSDCGRALLELLDPPAGVCGDGPTGQLTAGAAAVTCLMALVPIWRSAALRPHWRPTRGSLRLRDHLRRCTAAAAAAAGPHRNARGGSGGATVAAGVGGGGALAQLTAALRLTLTLFQLAGYVREDLFTRVRSWTQLLIDAHDAAAAAVAAPISGGRGYTALGAATVSTSRDASCLRAQALALELLRSLSASRRFWSALLPQRSRQQQRCWLLPSTLQKQPQSPPRDGGGGGGDGGGERLLASLAVHLRPVARSAPSGPPQSPLLPAAAALLCHPRLWSRGVRQDEGLLRCSRRGSGRDEGEAGGRGRVDERSRAGKDGAGAGGFGDGSGDCSPGQGVPAARRAALEAVLSCLAASGADAALNGSGSGVGGSIAAAWVPSTALLPVLAAALMPDAVPYGSKATEPAGWGVPDSPLWDPALPPTLALAARAVLLMGSGAGTTTAASNIPGCSSATLSTTGSATAAATTTASVCSVGVFDASGGVVSSGTESEVEAAAAAAAAWLLLRILAPRMTRGSMGAAVSLASRWAVALATRGGGGTASSASGPPPSAATASSSSATAAAAVSRTADVPVMATLSSAAFSAAGPPRSEEEVGAAVAGARSCAVLDAVGPLRAILEHFMGLADGGGGSGTCLEGAIGLMLMQLTSGRSPAAAAAAVSALGGRTTTESQRQYLRQQVLFAAATAAAAAAATGGRPSSADTTATATVRRGFGTTAAGFSPPSPLPLPPPTLQPLLWALSYCLRELLSRPLPPGIMAPSLPVHACLAAMLKTARELTPGGERAGAVHAAAGAAGDGCGGDAARLERLLVALARGPSLYGGSTADGPKEEMEVSWRRWWWAEAAEVAGAGAGGGSSGQRHAATAARYASDSSGGASGEGEDWDDGALGSVDEGDDDEEVVDDVGDDIGGGGGIGSGGCYARDAGDGGLGWKSANALGGGGEIGGPLAAAAALAATAPARLCRAVRQLIWNEIRCMATALLSTCFGLLASGTPAPPPQTTADHPSGSAGLSDSATAAAGAHGSFSGGGWRLDTPFASPQLRDEFSDATFSFSSSRGVPRAGESPAAAVAPATSIGLTSPSPSAAACSHSPALVATAAAAPAALVAAGCPTLAVRLLQALLPSHPSSGGVIAPESCGSGGSSRGVGVGVGAVGGSRVKVVPWPRVVRVQLGTRVPAAAFCKVLDYLVGGSARLPYIAAASPGGTAEVAEAEAAEAAAAREVAALAAVLGLPELRATARRALPTHPGCTPPPAMPRLLPLMPRQLLLITSPPPLLPPYMTSSLERLQPFPPPPQSPPPPPRAESTTSNLDPDPPPHDPQQRRGTGDEPFGVTVAPAYSFAAAGRGEPPVYGSSDTAPADRRRSSGHRQALHRRRCRCHPHLEDQLAAVMRWEHVSRQLPYLPKLPALGEVPMRAARSLAAV